MQQVTDVAGLQPSACADFGIGKVFGEFQQDQFAAALVKRGEAKPHKTYAFDADDLRVGQRGFVGGLTLKGRMGLICDGGQRNVLSAIAPVVERQIVHGAVEPSSWLAHFGELGMQFHERFLDQVFGNGALAGQAQCVTQQR